MHVRFVDATLPTSTRTLGPWMPRCSHLYSHSRPADDPLLTLRPSAARRTIRAELTCGKIQKLIRCVPNKNCIKNNKESSQYIKKFIACKRNTSYVMMDCIPRINVTLVRLRVSDVYFIDLLLIHSISQHSHLFSAKHNL